MGLKINKLYIKNFKVFKEVTIDFSKKKLTVLDGPNGFGKTTIYDAFELLLTGRIRRYNDIAAKIVKGSQSFTEMPFYHDNGDGTSIVIKAEIEVGVASDEKKIILIRKTKSEEALLELRSKHDFSIFNLFTTDNFESEDLDYREVSDSEQFLESILGKNYLENFEFLNYVEQEESYYMLKYKDKERKNNIQHLFNTKEFQNELAKIVEVKKHLQQLKKTLPDNIAEFKIKIEKLKENLSDSEETQYVQLFNTEEYFWDKPRIDFDTITYTEILGKNGILFKIENLVNNRDTFKVYLNNQKIRGILENDKSHLYNLLKFNKYLDLKELIFQEEKLHKVINLFEENCKTINSKNINDGLLDLEEKIFENYSKNINDGLLDLDDKIFENYFNKDEVNNYNETLKQLKELINNTNKTSKLYANLTSTRNNLISYFEKYRLETTEENENCPLCGYHWEKEEELLIQIKQQSDELEKLSDDFSKKLTKNIEEFKDKELNEVLVLFQKVKEETYFNEQYFTNFKDVDFEKVKSIKKFLSDNEVLYSDLINDNINPESEIKSDLLLSRLQEKIVKIDSGKIEYYFNELYSKYFKDEESSLLDFDIENIEVKRKYVEWQYSLFQSTQLTKLSKELNAKEKRLSLLKTKEDELKSLEKIYSESLKKYNAKVIKDIELLFHIYTGRILLDYQGGLGLFIKNDNDGLRFVTNPKRTYDVLFSMSAGQLSALIISFTLALNKIYSSKNKILFIDDPVQSMDEINISGCIELLRNEFADRQIFISTHESMMSTYMRYKFEKYNLSTKRINLKEIANHA